MLSRSIWATLLIVAALASVGSAVDECVATALAKADPKNAAGEAIANSIAQAFSTSISCEEENENLSPIVSSLAVSVAVAISSAEAAGMTCTADAEAVAEVVSDFITEGVTEGMLAGADEKQRTAAEAWLKAEAPLIAQRVRMATRGKREDGVVGGCLGRFGELLGSLNTAEDVGNALEDAIQQVMEAISCGTNVKDEKDDDEPAGCFYDPDQRQFVGNCSVEKPKKRDCNKEFKECAKIFRLRKCHKDLAACKEKDAEELFQAKPSKAKVKKAKRNGKKKQSNGKDEL